MGKLVQAQIVRYYGNVRHRPGDQFVMADSDFVSVKPVLDEHGKPVLEKDGKPKTTSEETTPMGVVVIEEGYEDPLVESEADLKAKQVGKPKKREAAKKQPDDHRQGGAFDIHPESGLQVTGQVAPAKPAVSSFVGADVAGAKPETGKEEDKKKSGKSVI